MPNSRCGYHYAMVRTCIDCVEVRQLLLYGPGQLQLHHDSTPSASSVWNLACIFRLPTDVNVTCSQRVPYQRASPIFFFSLTRYAKPGFSINSNPSDYLDLLLAATVYRRVNSVYVTCGAFASTFPARIFPCNFLSLTLINSSALSYFMWCKARARQKRCSGCISTQLRLTFMIQPELNGVGVIAKAQ
jgi:hypothetical protein